MSNNTVPYYSILNNSQKQQSPSAPTTPQQPVIMASPTVPMPIPYYQQQSPLNPYVIPDPRVYGVPVVMNQTVSEEETGTDADGTCGLQYLTTLDRIYIAQNKDVHKEFYVIKNKEGQNIYQAVQKSGFSSTKVSILDVFLKKIIQMKIDSSGMEVSALSDTVSAKITQLSQLTPEFNINLSGSEGTVLRIKGPSFLSRMCHTDIEFNINEPDTNRTLGKISRKWSGISQDLFTGNKYFGISFPEDMDVKLKAALICLSFHIGIKYYNF